MSYDIKKTNVKKIYIFVLKRKFGNKLIKFFFYNSTKTKSMRSAWNLQAAVFKTVFYRIAKVSFLVFSFFCLSLCTQQTAKHPFERFTLSLTLFFFILMFVNFNLNNLKKVTDKKIKNENL